MAAPPNVPIVTNTPLLSRFDDGNSGNTRQPSGPCNYKNLNIGGNATCGCRRFTDKSQELQGFGHAAQQRPGWCICEHHSCFHDHESVAGHRSAGDVSIAEGLSIGTPTKQVHAQPSAQSRHDVQMQDAPEVGRTVPPDILPDTLHWSNFISPNNDSQGSLPAIPSQCLLPSDNGSRTSGSQAGYGRPFAGKGLQTLNHVQKPRPDGRGPMNIGTGRVLGQNGKIMQIYEDSNGHGHLQSLTEVATPSARSSQDLDAELVFSKNVATVHNALQRIEENQATDADAALQPSGVHGSVDAMSITLRNDSNDDNLLPKIRSILNHVADYPMTRQNHEHRLDQLENASFHNAAVDNLRDDHELLESRVGELEGRMDSVEKQQMAQSDTTSFTSRQLVAASIDSRSSSALIASAIDHLDQPNIEALKAKIAELEALAPPSHSRPWEVEVVFIPFGPRLRGVWSTSQPSITQLSRVNSGSGDEWTQTQHNSLAAAQARLTAHDQAVAWETSAADLSDQQTPWLMSKACGSGTIVDSRLKSRGLVRTIQVKGPDARDVSAAILAAFGDLPSVLAADPYSHRSEPSSIPSSLSQYLGLLSPWIPLRKLHKNSCLRFLNTAEMITPALWTVQFLASSVAMRSSGVRRLYITQPDACIQHLGSTMSWTWQKIRQLDRFYPAQLNTSQTHTPEADAEEPCWAFDERYDTPPSPQSSISSHPSLTIRPISYEEEVDPVSLSDHFSSAHVSEASTTPTSLPRIRNQKTTTSSPLRERHPFRPIIHTRTTSMPTLTKIKIKSSPSEAPLQLTTSKRRITSEFEHDYARTPAYPHSSPTLPTILALNRENLKRQRTRSPSRPRDTPRWSVPPSPSPFLMDDGYKRGNTPFAYATPHSNAPYVPRTGSGSHDGYDDSGDELERGSTTDVDNNEDANVDEDECEEDGGDHNALSDYEYDGPLRASQEEWNGVQDHDSFHGYTHGSGHGFSARYHTDADADVDGDGADSVSDSCPSEYPSRQIFDEEGSPGNGDEDMKAGFRIHVDEEGDIAY